MAAIDDAITILDYQIDYNIKIITFILLLAYVLGIWWTSKNMESDAIWKVFYKFFAKIFIYPTIYFLPLFTIMLFREYDAITMWATMLSFYGIVFALTALIGILFGWSKVLESVGIDVDLGLISSEKLNKGEKY